MSTIPCRPPTDEEIVREQHRPRRTDMALVMIVKDEYGVFARCLRPFRPLLREAVICDTGSSDPDRLRRIAWDALGPAVRLLWCNHEWVDFAFNRNRAVLEAQAWCTTEYLVTIDADDTLYAPPEWSIDGTADLYTIPVDYAGLRYARRAIFRRSLPWRYECPVHEVLVCDAPHTTRDLDDAVIVVGRDGARSAVGGAEKFSRDAEILERHLARHPHDARAQYYLAQSHRDVARCTGDPVEQTRRYDLARRAYDARAVMGGWDQEVYSALLEAAKCREALCDDSPVEFSRVLDAYLRAKEARPQRAEALYHAMRFARARGYSAIADALEPAWQRIAMTSDILFVEPGCYP